MKTFYIYNDEHFKYRRKNNSLEHILPNYKTEIQANNLKEAKKVFIYKYNLNPFYYTFSETKINTNGYIIK